MFHLGEFDEICLVAIFHEVEYARCHLLFLIEQWATLITNGGAGRIIEEQHHRGSCMG